MPSGLIDRLRVIYYIDKKEVIIFILEVSAHDYRKKT